MVETPFNCELCAGFYHLVVSQTKNGFPLWKHGARDRWIYSGHGTQFWVIGGPTEASNNFECDEGFIAASDLHNGLMPHLFRGGWQEDDGTNWLEDPRIRVTHAEQTPNLLYVASPSGAHEVAGYYDLVPDWLPNSFPFWKQVCGRHWLYSGLSGVWLFGSDEEYQKRFSCEEGVIAGTDRHNGRMPDKVVHGWQRDDGMTWIADPLFAVVELSESTIPHELVVDATDALLELTGPYTLVIGAQVNGFPVWEQLGAGRRWIYSGHAGGWLIGVGLERDSRIASATSHGGRLPHDFCGGWMRRGAIVWEIDVLITVSSAREGLSIIKGKPPLPPSNPSPQLLEYSSPASLQVVAPGQCAGLYMLFPVWRMAGHCGCTRIIRIGSSTASMTGGSSETTARGRCILKPTLAFWPVRIHTRARCPKHIHSFGFIAATNRLR